MYKSSSQKNLKGLRTYQDKERKSNHTKTIIYPLLNVERITTQLFLVLQNLTLIQWHT